MRRQQAAPDVDHDRHAQTHQLAHLDRAGEALDPEVARVHLQDAAGVRADGVGVVREVGAVGGPDLAQARPGAGDEVRQPEAVTDLHHLPPAHDHLAAGGQRRRSQHQRRGAVVHREHVLGVGHRRPQCRQGPSSAAGPGAVGHVELHVDVARGHGQGLDRRRRQRCPTQVGVQDDPGRVEHRAQRGAAGGQRGDGVRHQLLGLEVTGADQGLRRDHDGLDRGRSEPRGRGHQRRVGQGHVRARDPAARVGHAVWPFRVANARRRASSAARDASRASGSCTDVRWASTAVRNGVLKPR